MSSIATDEPRERAGLLAIRAIQPDIDAVAARRELDELHPAFDVDAKAVQPVLQQALGLRLRQHQAVWKWRVDAAHLDPADRLVAGNDVDRRRLEAGIDKGRGVAAAREQFERPAPHHKGLGLVGAGGCLVDDPDRYAVARQLDRQGQPDRPGADDEKLGGHAKFLHSRHRRNRQSVAGQLLDRIWGTPVHPAYPVRCGPGPSAPEFSRRQPPSARSSAAHRRRPRR